jgi:hypothetical protein
MPSVIFVLRGILQLFFTVGWPTMYKLQKPSITSSILCQYIVHNAPFSALACTLEFLLFSSEPQTRILRSWLPLYRKLVYRDNYISK